MIAKLFSATTIGLEAQKIEVEIDLTPALPSMVVVGLPTKPFKKVKNALNQPSNKVATNFP